VSADIVPEQQDAVAVRRGAVMHAVRAPVGFAQPRELLDPVQDLSGREGDRAGDGSAQQRIQRVIEKRTLAAAGGDRAFHPESFRQRYVGADGDADVPFGFVHFQLVEIVYPFEKSFSVEKACRQFLQMVAGAKQGHHFTTIQVNGQGLLLDQPLGAFPARSFSIAQPGRNRAHFLFRQINR